MRSNLVDFEYISNSFFQVATIFHNYIPTVYKIVGKLKSSKFINNVMKKNILF